MAPRLEDRPGKSTSTAKRGVSVRLEIQYLRALAVVSVVIFHYYPTLAPGGFVGVDIFFVISGYLITTHLLKEITAGKISLAAFWARRARRIIPAALLTILVTFFAGLFIVPNLSELYSYASHALASTLFYENWQLIVQNLGYGSATADVSPFQQFWSLGIEEQFYLLWPLLLAFTVFLFRGDDRKFKAVGFVIIGILVVSFVYSLVVTHQDSTTAYLSTPARIWQLAFGGLVAYFMNRFKPVFFETRYFRALGWATLFVGIFFIREEGFPGLAALVPVLGTALVILAGHRESSGKTFKASMVPVLFIGTISFSIYLWHWPMLILIQELRNHELGGTFKVLLLVAVLFISWFSEKFVERPIRFSKKIDTPKKALNFAAVGILVVATLSGTTAFTTNWAVAVQAQIQTASSVELTDCAGAAYFADYERCSQGTFDYIVPAPVSAGKDAPREREKCTGNPSETIPFSCSYKTAATPSFRAVILGDSHALQVATPVADLVTSAGGQLDTYLRVQCPFFVKTPTTLTGNQGRLNCATWNKNLQKKLETGQRYDYIFVAAFAGSNIVGSEQESVANYTETLKFLTTISNNVIVLHDLPMGRDAVLCLQRNAEKGPKCGTSQNEAQLPDRLFQASKNIGSVNSIDLSNTLCRQGYCPAVLGGVLPYRDTDHITATFARTLLTPLKCALAARGIVLGETPVQQ